MQQIFPIRQNVGWNYLNDRSTCRTQFWFSIAPSAQTFQVKRNWQCKEGYDHHQDVCIG